MSQCVEACEAVCLSCTSADTLPYLFRDLDKLNPQFVVHAGSSVISHPQQGTDLVLHCSCSKELHAGHVSEV